MDEKSAPTGGRQSRRGRLSGRRERSGATIQQPPFKQPRLPYEPIRAVSDDQLEAIHVASLTILREIGIDVLNDEARDILQKGGAEIVAGTKMVRFDRALIDQAVASAPSLFTLHARNPAHSLNLGENWIAFSAVSSAPNSCDLDNGRRPGNERDFVNFIKLGQSLNAVHLWGGYPVEPIDLHPSIRHLVALKHMITYSDKAVYAYSLGTERIMDSLEMVRIARGLTAAEFDQQPSITSVINTNSPLRLDVPMAQGIIEMARHNQIAVVTPFTLAGAMAPVTLAGALAQQNAEALAGLVLSQMTRPGAPFIYGGFTSNVDMKSGAPAFGTPEYMKTAIIGGQLARHYGLPYRSSNVNAANGLDMQAAYESVFALWGSIMGGVNLMKHGAGWMEGGLQASFEKMVMDADLLQMVMEFLNPITVNDDELGLDAIREVGPGGHFFGCDHTQARYQNAFFAPMISDWRNYETWMEAGQPNAAQKANQIYKQIIAEYQPPPLDPAISEELDAFVAKRIEEGGAPTDF